MNIFHKGAKRIFEHARNILWRFFIHSRTVFWAIQFRSMGRGTQVLGRVVIYYPNQLDMGECSTLNEGVFIQAKGFVKIGDHVHLSPHVVINTGGLMVDGKVGKDREHFYKPVIIEDGVWVGSNVCINPGVTVGAHSVIGAGAVVTKDIPPYSVAVGVPAQVIRSLR